MASDQEDRSRSRSRLRVDHVGHSSSSNAPAGAICAGRRSPLRRSCWRMLRSLLDEVHGVDSWHLRSKPSVDAPIVGILWGGEAIQCLGETEDRQWLKVLRKSEGPQEIVYAARFYYDRDSGVSVEAFMPSGAPELCEQNLSKQRSNPTERREALLQELTSFRNQYEQLAVGQRDAVRVQTSRKIERLMDELDALGVPYDQILSSSDPMTMLLRASSYEHRDFVNPDAETCWLSCLFQSLWHSVVFHAAFDLYLAPSKCTPQADEKLLTALQRTWCAYSEEGRDEHDVDAETLDVDMMSSIDSPYLVPNQDLVEGFGPGYGDMAEALASIQNELSKSSNQAARTISNLIALIPLVLEDSWPDPAKAWSLAVGFEATDIPILAVDLSLPQLSRDSNRRLGQLWIPQQETLGTRSDLGPRHRIVALVCYMWNLRHYVTFCRRQSDTEQCLFFNDLPGLTRGAPREVAWRDVPTMCYRYNLAPRLVLYESLGAAEEVVRKLPERDRASGCLMQ